MNGIRDPHDPYIWNFHVTYLKGRRNNKVERRSRFISSSLSPIWLLRSSGLNGKVGLYSASKMCRRNGNIVTDST